MTVPSRYGWIRRTDDGGRKAASLIDNWLAPQRICLEQRRRRVVCRLRPKCSNRHWRAIQLTERLITDIEVSAIAMQLEPLFSGKDHAVDVEGHSFGGVVALRLGAPTEIVDPPSVIAGTRRHLYLSCNGGHGNT